MPKQGGPNLEAAFPLARRNMEDIAIVGFSLRFPQDAVSPESFWNMLAEGRSAATEVPESRFNINAFYHPDPDRLGSVSACFLLLSNLNHRSGLIIKPR